MHVYEHVLCMKMNVHGYVDMLSIVVQFKYHLTLRFSYVTIAFISSGLKATFVLVRCLVNTFLFHQRIIFSQTIYMNSNNIQVILSCCFSQNDLYMKFMLV